MARIARATSARLRYVVFAGILISGVDDVNVDFGRGPSSTRTHTRTQRIQYRRREPKTRVVFTFAWLHTNANDDDDDSRHADTHTKKNLPHIICMCAIAQIRVLRAHNMEKKRPG